MQGAIFPICISKGEGPLLFFQSGRGEEESSSFFFFDWGLIWEAF